MNLLIEFLQCCMWVLSRFRYRDLLPNHIKHIILNDTHLIKLNNSHYVILNPNSDKPVLAFVQKNGDILTNESGQLSPVHPDHEGQIVIARDVSQRLQELSQDPTQLISSDRFVSLECPSNGSVVRVVAKQNMDSMVVRQDEYASVVYVEDEQLFSVHKKKILGKTNVRIFWLGDFLVIIQAEISNPFVHTVLRERQTDRKTIHLEALAAKIDQELNKVHF